MQEPQPNQNYSAKEWTASEEQPSHPEPANAESAELLSALTQKVEQLEKELQEKESRYLYLYAEFENFKKRWGKERSDLIKFGWESVARDLLYGLDNLHRALEHSSAHTDPALVQGLQMSLREILTAIQKQGVQVIQSLGTAFDPHLHDAIGQEPSAQPAGTVIQEHAPGYTLHGRLLRPARVVVSSGPAGESPVEK